MLDFLFIVYAIVVFLYILFSKEERNDSGKRGSKSK